ncbi:hypothetical protein QVD17_00196 [Tagetes erecta]|uniref:Uncharacterized protein n=1 Tax=Tagetes erecta TaxID=13708 RepID=A0AAD8L7E7_TARER|nr:hypothetical protein QVD17_00196 [Tagetes erecta]
MAVVVAVVRPSPFLGHIDFGILALQQLIGYLDMELYYGEQKLHRRRWRVYTTVKGSVSAVSAPYHSGCRKITHTQLHKWVGVGWGGFG